MEKKTMISSLVLAALVGTGFAGSALAHDKEAMQERRTEIFAELDQNGDGMVTLEELQARADARFAEADTDGNGVLSKEELAAMGGDRAKERAERRIDRMIDRLDTNDDGALSQAELQDRRDPTKFFDRLDANDDGNLTAEEFAEAKGKMGRKGKGGKGHGKRNN